MIRAPRSPPVRGSSFRPGEHTEGDHRAPVGLAGAPPSIPSRMHVGSMPLAEVDIEMETYFDRNRDSKWNTNTMLYVDVMAVTTVSHWHTLPVHGAWLSECSPTSPVMEAYRSSKNRCKRWLQLEESAESRGTRYPDSNHLALRSVARRAHDSRHS